LNIAAGTKEEKNSLDQTERTPALSLVPRSVSRSSKRAFSIGVSDDVFARVDHRRRALSGSTDGDRHGGLEHVHGAATDIRPIRRVEPIIVIAAAGALLGYLLGRYSQK
jgi:hypothetical protein